MSVDISGVRSGWSLPGSMPTSVSPQTRKHGKPLCWLGPPLEYPRAEGEEVWCKQSLGKDRAASGRGSERRK